MNLTINPIKTPTFKQAPKYKVLRDIPNLPCACCGKPVFTQESLLNAYKVIVKPFSKIISVGFMDEWKNKPNLWQCFQQFIEKYPGKSLDKILEEKDSQKALQAANIENNDIFKVLYQSRQNLRSAGVVMKRLSAFKKFLISPHVESFEQLQIYAQKYPKKTLSEIVNLDEVHEYHSQRRSLNIKHTVNKRNFHYNNIELMIKKINPNAVEEFKCLKPTLLDIYKCPDKDAVKYQIKQIFIKFLIKNNCEKIKNKVLAELDQAPIYNGGADAFFCYAYRHKLSDFAIINKLLTPYSSSFEHVVPDSQSGTAHQNNGLIMHVGCNRKRSNKKYDSFIKYHPYMPYNIQKQINYVSNLILQGKLDPSFNLCPIKISNTLNTYTDGVIIPEYDEFCKKARKKSQIKNKKIQVLKNKLKELQKEIKDTQKKLEPTKRLIEELNKEIEKESNK